METIDEEPIGNDEASFHQSNLWIVNPRLSGTFVEVVHLHYQAQRAGAAILFAAEGIGALTR
jgi:hypothetical protein